MTLLRELLVEFMDEHKKRSLTFSKIRQLFPHRAKGHINMALRSAVKKGELIHCKGVKEDYYVRKPKPMIEVPPPPPPKPAPAAKRAKPQKLPPCATVEEFVAHGGRIQIIPGIERYSKEKSWTSLK